MIKDKILLITPGIRNSRGHEIHGYAIEQALKQFTNVEVRKLKELDTSLIGRLFIWPLIEFMKDLIASLPKLKFDEATRGATHKEYKVALSTKLIGRGLVKFLKEQPNYQDITLVSSHYAAIAAAKTAGLKKLVLIGPDFFPHAQTAIPEVLITSPGKAFTEELIEFNIKKENIRETGTILTPNARKNAKKYKDVRAKVATEKENPMHILITIGGAGPEIKYVIETVKKLKELILTGHQLASISLIVGDNRPSRIRLRKKLTGIIEKHLLKDIKGSGFRMFGGTKETQKMNEVAKTWEILESSPETNGLPPVDLIFTRPNDISLIATAMGIPTILFPASGSHEVKALKYLSNELNCSVPYEKWMKLKQPGEIINLGEPLSARIGEESGGFINSDSGDQLIKIVREL